MSNSLSEAFIEIGSDDVSNMSFLFCFTLMVVSYVLKYMYQVKYEKKIGVDEKIKREMKFLAPDEIMYENMRYLSLYPKRIRNREMDMETRKIGSKYSFFCFVTFITILILFYHSF